MKKIYGLFILTIILISTVNAQQSDNLDRYVGTWKYTSGDTIFTIKIAKGTFFNSIFSEYKECILGGYSLKVNGVLVEDYIKPLPNLIALGDSHPDQNVYITGEDGDMSGIGFMFYDQRIKHEAGFAYGELIPMADNKMRWKLNEYSAWWISFEGSSEPVEYKEQGFSVPNNIILTKEDAEPIKRL